MRFISLLQTAIIYDASRRAVTGLQDDGGSKLLARLTRAADLLRHPWRHGTVRGAVAAPVFHGIRRRQPQLTIKYLHPRYLLRDAGTAERAAIFVHHYAFLRERLPEGRLRALLDGGETLWTATGPEGAHAIELDFSHPTDNEGELTLTYRLGSTPVHLLSFSFAPGPLVGAAEPTAVLVTRLQRAKGCGEAFKAATRAMRGLAPASALLAALQGWVETFGVTRLVGVAAARQVCIADGEAAAFLAAYDDIFAGLGGIATDGLFSVPLPPPERPLAEIKPGNRPRTKVQRELKRQIAAAAQAPQSPAVAPVRAGPGAVAMVFPSAFAQERDGSQARAAALLDRLVAEHGDVIVYSDPDHDASPWTEAARHAFRARWPTVELALEPQGRPLALATAAKALATALWPAAAAAVLCLRLPRMTPVWDDVRARATLVVVNYKSALVGLNGVDPATCMVETHDLLWLKWAKLAGASPISVAALRRLRGEIGVLDATRGVVAISPAEAAFFRMLLGRAPTFYVSAWMAPPCGPQGCDGGATADFDLVFVASAYPMNARGFCAALERHGSWLGSRRIAVCGTICDDPAVKAAAARHPGVTLLGFVEDLSALYRRSKAALVPVDGTGLKMKLVSALGAGLPALVTPPVLEGLPPGHEGAVFPLDGTVAASLLDDPARLAAARQAALRYNGLFHASGEAEAAVAAMKAVLRATPAPVRATQARWAGSGA